MNHRWYNNTCKHCGITRERHTWKVLRAIVGNRDVYEYGTAIAYQVNGKWTFKRPECEVPRFTIVTNTTESNYITALNKKS